MRLFNSTFIFIKCNKNKANVALCTQQTESTKHTHSTEMEGEGDYIPVKLIIHDNLHFSYYKCELEHQVSLDSPWKNVNNGYYFAFTSHLMKPIKNLC
jgi:hypothetical protein